MSNLFIINDVDRPYEPLIVFKNFENVGRYVDQREGRSRYEFTDWEKATRLEDFGIEVEEVRNGWICIQVRQSDATYCNNEAVRSWQGSDRFVLMFIEDEE